MIDGFNTPLAIDILANIEDVKDSGGHDQNFWGRADMGSPFVKTLEKIETDYGEFVGYGSCNTAMCYAGWGLTLSGVKMIWSETEDADYLVAAMTADEKEIHLEAAKLLGIPHHHDTRNNPYWDYEQGFSILFRTDNTLDDLYALTAEYAGLEVEELEVLVKEKQEEYHLTSLFAKQEITVLEKESV